MSKNLLLLIGIAGLLLTGCQTAGPVATRPFEPPAATPPAAPAGAVRDAAGQAAEVEAESAQASLWAAILIQAPDDSLTIFTASGGYVPFSTPGFRLIGGPFNEAALVDGALYAVGAGTADQPPGLYRITPEETTRLVFVPDSADSVAIWPGPDPQAIRIAWSELNSTSDGGLESVINMADIAGSTIRELGRREGQDRILSVVGWSADGAILYFSQEPLVSGGYTLFGGYSTLYAMDIVGGTVTEIVEAERFGGAAACLDELSPDETLLALHCEAPTLLDIASGDLTIIQLPQASAGLNQFGTLRFNPDGSRVALALAAGNFETEQGAVALADVMSGEAGIIVESQPGAYYEVAGWMDADTLILQEWDLTSGSGAVYRYSLPDGELQLVGAGQFVAFLPAND